MVYIEPAIYDKCTQGILISVPMWTADLIHSSCIHTLSRCHPVTWHDIFLYEVHTWVRILRLATKRGCQWSVKTRGSLVANQPLRGLWVYKNQNLLWNFAHALLVCCFATWDTSTGTHYCYHTSSIHCVSPVHQLHSMGLNSILNILVQKLSIFESLGQTPKNMNLQFQMH